MGAPEGVVELQLPLLLLELPLPRPTLARSHREAWMSKKETHTAVDDSEKVLQAQAMTLNPHTGHSTAPSYQASRGARNATDRFRSLYPVGRHTASLPRNRNTCVTPAMNGNVWNTASTTIQHAFGKMEPLLV